MKWSGFMLCFLLLVVVIMILVAALGATQIVDEGRSEEIEELKEEREKLYADISAVNAKANAEKKYSEELRKENERLKEQIQTMQALIYEKSDREETETGYMKLPEGDTNMFCCMDYRKLTNTKSDQYQLQLECFTGEETGIRVYHDGEKLYYSVAMGSAYSRTIGDAFEITLENGNVFNVVLGDFKDDGTFICFGHPCKNYDGHDCTCVVEFIVDMERVPDNVVKAGTFSTMEKFGGLHGTGGNIKSIKPLGNVLGQ